MGVGVCEHAARIELRCTLWKARNVILSISDHSSEFVVVIKAKTYSSVLKRTISRAIFFFFPCLWPGAFLNH